MKKTADRCAAPYTENNPGAAMPGVCFLLPYRCATAQRRSNGAASAAIGNLPAPITAAPPYCYLVPGVTPEAAAMEAVKALHIETPVDALAILWELRRMKERN